MDPERELMMDSAKKHEGTFQLKGRRKYNVLLIPDWLEQLQPTLDFLRRYLQYFLGQSQILLALKVDPELTEGVASLVLTEIKSFCEETGYGETDLPEINLLNDPLSPEQLKRLLSDLQGYIFLDPEKDKFWLDAAIEQGCEVFDGRNVDSLRIYLNQAEAALKPLLNADKIDLIRENETMYQRRLETNPAAFRMDYWAEHFCLRTALASDAIHGKVLDFGCGTGEITLWLGRYGYEVTGVDISAMAIEVARRHWNEEEWDVQQRVQFYEGTLEDLSFPEKPYDSCLMSEVIEHITDPGPIFRKLAVLLKKESRILILVPLGHAFDDPTHVHHFAGTEDLHRYLQHFAEEVEVLAFPEEGQLVAQISVLRTEQVGMRLDKLVCMMRVRNEEAWIGRSLAQTSKVADAIVILDDGSTDRTPEICQSFPKVVRYERQDIEETDEVRDKNKLLRWTLELEPDWILALDGDEVLEDLAVSTVRQAMALCPEEVSSLSFEFLFLWDGETQYRMDGKYADTFHPRLFRVSKKNRANLLFLPSVHGGNFHCGSLPKNLKGEELRLDIKVKHYGYFDREQRMAKYAYYQRIDSEHARQGYYEHLIDESAMELEPWHERSTQRVLDQILQWRMNQGIFLMRKGDFPRAFQQFKAITAVVPGLAEVHEAIQTVKLEIQEHYQPQTSSSSSPVQAPRVPVEEGYFEHTRPEVVKLIPPTIRSVLDVGCAAGAMGQMIRHALPSCRVVGIEVNPAAAAIARTRLEQVIEGDIEQMALGFPKGYFDCITLADVLEHLRDPWSVLARLVEMLPEGGVVVASLPNIRNLSVILELLGGHWRYLEAGILDRTHLRFFTLAEAQEMFVKAGLKVERVEYVLDEFLPVPADAEGRQIGITAKNVEIKDLTHQDVQELGTIQFLIRGVKI